MGGSGGGGLPRVGGNGRPVEDASAAPGSKGTEQAAGLRKR